MKFWKNNRADAEFDMPVDEVARLFLASAWADHPWPLDRKLRAFLTDPDGPISAVWEDEQAYDEVCKRILTGESAPAPAAAVKPPRITPTQLAVLRAAEEGRLYRSERAGSLYQTMIRAGGGGGLWPSTVRESTIRRLADLELVELGEQVRDRRPWVLTDKGRAAVEAAAKATQRAGAR